MTADIVPFPTVGVRQVHQCTRCDCQTWYLDCSGFVVCAHCGHVAVNIAFAAISAEEKAAKLEQLDELLGDAMFAERLEELGWVKR